MEKKTTKKEIVRMLLNKDISEYDEEELIDLLVDEPISIDIDKEALTNISFGDKVADKITNIAGSWGFIIGFSSFLIIWVLLNLFVFDDLDPYPFILLNLLLSCIAALQAPIIMMSQNRAAKKDSMRGQNDYRIDLKSELILEELHDRMEKIEKSQKEILKQIEELKSKKKYLEVNMKNLIIKKCNKCGALIHVLDDCDCSDCGIICCNETMVELKPNVTDAAIEKHVPVVEKDGDIIKVKVNHVMEREHYIEWLLYVSSVGEEIVYFKPGDEVQAQFKYEPNSKVYAYCNKHNLWVCDID